MHPGADTRRGRGLAQPHEGTVQVRASVAHAQRGGNGIEWWIVRETKAGRKNLAHGVTDGRGSQTIPAEAEAQGTGRSDR